MKKLLKRLFGKPEDQEFISLMQVALENPSIKQQLMSILSLPDENRRATIRQWRSELDQQNAPEPIIKALKYLEEDGPAHRARELLTGEEI
ncbi:MAG: hypothetical protein JJ934_02580 [Pseudomonadales bacterium]|nr:hypothetical protein [Pseudomonadales bacterium]MBO6565229.1 hypothetical protein [Pseudomonadales bacterium]MBO6595363.1 hypothetical protein [Pseudomonadales bacterium]MBO6655749.1 hypothetical protein [Pseudomonadales bacterium]MBO6701864.1 hypothetical protein [Pseudomonadales bacterium]